MEVIHRGELYDKNGAGEYEYHHTIVVYKFQGQLYRGVCQRRIQDFYIELGDVSDAVLIPTEAFCPLVPPNITRVPEDLLGSCYIKTPHLSGYTPSKPTEIGDKVLREVAILEILKRNPHPNIAKYVGCRVCNGRIVGICFVRYCDTLQKRVNPGNHGKTAFKYVDSKYPLKDREKFLSGAESGIRHLHSLGLIHNDVKPCNIMIDDEDNPIIIDFDNCCLDGEELGTMGGTWPWANPTKTAMPRNDLDVLYDIREWLSDSSKKNFRLNEG